MLNSKSKAIMAKKFNYLAASIIVVAVNVPFYVLLWFSGDNKIPVNIATNVVLVAFGFFAAPIATVLFLRRFSDGVNLRNGLILGIFVSIGCILLDSLVIGLFFGVGLTFFNNWLFPVVYLEIVIFIPLAAYISNRMAKR